MHVIHIYTYEIKNKTHNILLHDFTSIITKLITSFIIQKKAKIKIKIKIRQKKIHLCIYIYINKNTTYVYF